MWATSFILSLINIVFGIIELFIGLRIIFRLLGASPVAPFVSWIYEMSDSLVWPFLGMFPSPALEGGFVVDFSAIIALLVYAFIGYLLASLVAYITYHTERLHKH